MARTPSAQRTHREQWFKNRIAWDKLQIDRLKAVGLNEALGDEIKKNPADFTSAILDTLNRRALEVSNDPAAGPGMTKIWLGLYMQALSFEKNQELRERRMSLREREVALREMQFDKLKKTVQNSRLSPEERAKRCREIFNLSANEPDKARSETNGQNGSD